MNFLKKGTEAKKFIEDANKMFKKLRTIHENNELDENQKEQDMETILTEKGVELFSKKAFLGGDSLFDKIIQYNTQELSLSIFKLSQADVKSIKNLRLCVLHHNVISVTEKANFCSLLYLLHCRLLPCSTGRCQSLNSL